MAVRGSGVATLCGVRRDARQDSDEQDEDGAVNSGSSSTAHCQEVFSQTIRLWVRCRAYQRRVLEKPQGGFTLFPCYSSPVASLVMTDNSQLTSDSQNVAAITTSASIFDCVDSYETAWPVAMMMELSHSLTLNEEALQQIPEAKRPVFVFEWLRFLDKVLVAAQKVSVPFLGVLSLTIS
uniref:Uncharacterized protein n=1 Tax=Timema monikensis TaxID=170555 RepID=A0A7R9DZE9_9NEOP|nr:unnamed protein product [Timema monikensis]